MATDPRDELSHIDRPAPIHVDVPPWLRDESQEASPSFELTPVPWGEPAARHGGAAGSTPRDKFAKVETAASIPAFSPRIDDEPEGLVRPDGLASVHPTRTTEPDRGWISEPERVPPPPVARPPLTFPPPRRAPIERGSPPTPVASVSRVERANATLEAQDVSCWFGSRKVLEGVTLTMPPGAITALIGPSGCGKSTFLRSLNRMHELTPGASLAGSIRLDGRDIYGPDATPTETRYQIGMVFQRPNPFPAMSIAGNVLAGLKLSGTRSDGSEETLETCLRRAGLWNEARDRLGSSGASLSGGQQQRLCIARALALHPKVLLMDEPCSALDPISTRVIEETMLAIKDEVTIVIVTHNMQQAQRVSDQCALFLVDEENAPGRIVEAGPTRGVFSSPTDSRTLDYVSGRFG